MMYKSIPAGEVTVQDENQQMRILASRVDGLPALPVIASKLLEMVDDPETSAADLASLISTDPALAARLLKLANSAFYGFPKRIGTVNLAVVALGLETVRDLCLSVLIADCFFQDSENLPFEMTVFWRHSLSVGVASRMICKLSGADRPGEGFIAGLLHDIGKLFLGKYFPKDYREMINIMERESRELLNAERDQFGVTHPVAGSWLIEEWNLPEWLMAAVRDHHQQVVRLAPGESDCSRLARVVAFADYLVRKLLDTGEDTGVDAPITKEMIRELKLKQDTSGAPEIEYYLAELGLELERAQGFMETICQQC